MGLERIAAVLQGKHDNYAIDLFATLIRAIAELTNVRSDGPHKASHRVIADHLRASSFLVAEGVLPSNEGRDCICCAVIIGAPCGTPNCSAPKAADVEAGAAAGARDGPGLSGTLVRAEGADRRDAQTGRDALCNTLVRGLASSEEAPASPRAPCSTARRRSRFVRHLWHHSDHQVRCARAGISVDIASFTDAMERQREKARFSWSGSGDTATETIWFAPREKAGASRFHSTARPRSPKAWWQPLVKGRQGSGRTEKKGESGAVVMNQTPFYGKSGGQVGDLGEMRRGRAPCRHRYAEKGRRPVRASGHGSSRAPSKSAIRCWWKSTMPRRHKAEPFRHPSTARGASPGAGRSCRAEEGLAGGARSAAF